MPEFEVGVDFSEVENTDTFEPMPVATYEFQILEANPKTTEKGRDMISWVLGIINHEEFNGRQVFYNTPMPWTNPTTGQRDISGISFLVGLCKGVGQSWDGGTFVSEPLVGLTGMVELKQRQKKEKQDDGTYKPINEYTNEVKRFVY